MDVTECFFKSFIIRKTRQGGQVFGDTHGSWRQYARGKTIPASTQSYTRFWGHFSHCESVCERRNYFQLITVSAAKAFGLYISQFPEWAVLSFALLRLLDTNCCTYEGFWESNGIKKTFHPRLIGGIKVEFGGNHVWLTGQLKTASSCVCLPI